MRAANRKKIINEEKIEKIRTFWQRNSHKALRMCDIKNGVWDRNEKAPCDSTLAHTLKKKLNMSYRILSIQPPKTTTKEHIRTYWESVMIQCSLANRGFELVFVDEFHISTHRSRFKGWAFKDCKSAVTSTMDKFSMYFTLGVSENHIYGLMASEKANNAKIFIHILDNLMKCREKVLEGNISNACFIIDNASIHKTTEVKTFVRRRLVSLLTIPSYSPALNGAETVIQGIKSKVKQRRNQGR